MDTIRINRQRLLETLEQNKAQHESDFAEAHKAWTKKATKALKKAAQKAEEEGVVEVHPLKDLPKPESYVKSYDDAIRRVEFDVRDEVELDDREFSAWVQDDWNWRGAFLANTGSYLGGH
jgi:hypothetical protein